MTRGAPFARVCFLESDRIAKALECLSETLQSDPLKGPATYATATAQLVDGLRCRVMTWAEQHSPVGRTVRDAAKNTLTIEIV